MRPISGATVTGFDPAHVLAIRANASPAFLAVTGVPEPGSLVLVGLGCCGLLVAVRRRRR